MNYSFNPFMEAAWSVTDQGIVYDGVPYKWSDFIDFKVGKVPTNKWSRGSISVYLSELNHLSLVYDFKDKDSAAEAIKYISDAINAKKEAEEAKVSEIRAKKEAKDSIGLIYGLNGARGRNMRVYEDRCVISVVAKISSLLTGNVTDGEKTIYYVDCIGVQFKKGGALLGYLQLETASGMMNNKSSDFFNENTFTFDSNVLSNEYMEEVADYIQSRVSAIKNAKSQPAATQVSAADELIKFKGLLDMGIITQEEFDAKKKQLLGL